MADSEVVISEPKTQRGRRRIALDRRTLSVLRAWQERQSSERALVGHGYIDSGMVFTQPDGSAIKPYLFTDWFEAHVKRCGLPRIRLHDYADHRVMPTSAGIRLPEAVNVLNVSA